MLGPHAKEGWGIQFLAYKNVKKPISWAKGGPDPRTPSRSATDSSWNTIEGIQENYIYLVIPALKRCISPALHNN